MIIYDIYISCISYIIYIKYITYISYISYISYIYIYHIYHIYNIYVYWMTHHHWELHSYWITELDKPLISFIDPTPSFVNVNLATSRTGKIHRMSSPWPPGSPSTSPHSPGGESAHGIRWGKAWKMRLPSS